MQHWLRGAERLTKGLLSSPAAGPAAAPARGTSPAAHAEDPHIRIQTVIVFAHGGCNSESCSCCDLCQVDHLALWAGGSFVITKEAEQ